MWARSLQSLDRQLSHRNEVTTAVYYVNSHYKEKTVPNTISSLFHYKYLFLPSNLQVKFHEPSLLPSQETIFCRGDSVGHYMHVIEAAVVESLAQKSLLPSMEGFFVDISQRRQLMVSATRSRVHVVYGTSISMHTVNFFNPIQMLVT